MLQRPQLLGLHFRVMLIETFQLDLAFLSSSWNYYWMTDALGGRFALWLSGAIVLFCSLFAFQEVNTGTG